MDISKLQTRRLFSPNPKSPTKTLTLLLSTSSAIAPAYSSSSLPTPRPNSLSSSTPATPAPGSTSSPTESDPDPQSPSKSTLIPGLSSYVGEEEKVGESLVELVEFGRRRVARESWGETEIRLLATAGLRMVEDDAARERILESCRRVLRGSGFRFRDDWAGVISGSDEGIFAWVAANYALGTLGGDPLETTGIMELGGASAQVTFVSGELLPPEFGRVFEFGEKMYSIYSNSFLHFGQNVAYWSVQELLSLRGRKSSAESAKGEMFIDPCSPKGFSHGLKSFNNSAAVLSPKPENHFVARSSNFSECRSAAFSLLQKEKGGRGRVQVEHDPMHINRQIHETGINGELAGKSEKCVTFRFEEQLISN